MKLPPASALVARHRARSSALTSVRIAIPLGVQVEEHVLERRWLDLDVDEPAQGGELAHNVRPAGWDPAGHDIAVDDWCAEGFGRLVWRGIAQGHSSLRF